MKTAIVSFFATHFAFGLFATVQAQQPSGRFDATSRGAGLGDASAMVRLFGAHQFDHADTHQFVHHVDFGGLHH